MGEFTPTTEQVRRGYVMNMRNTFVGATSELEAEFDRWLLSLISAATPSVEVYVSRLDYGELGRLAGFAESELGRRNTAARMRNGEDGGGW